MQKHCNKVICALCCSCSSMPKVAGVASEQEPAGQGIHKPHQCELSWSRMVVYSSVLFVSLMHCVQRAHFKDTLHGDMGMICCSEQLPQ